jgi:S-adenosylmethionine:diacylglycerol 3-amino-3-carboxypropyl transferase
LNCGYTGLLKSFVEITHSTSYLLGRMPPELRDLVCNELDAQRVSHNELPTKLRRSELLLATIGGSQFFCETAEAEFQD